MFRGPLVMDGYYGNEDATRASIEPDGWLHSGDIATMDEDGYFTIVDRKTDMILTAGFNVYPAEIERVLCMHPAVALAAVSGVPDERQGRARQGLRRPQARSDSHRRRSSSPIAASTSPPTRSRAPSSSSTRCRSLRPARSCAACSRTSTTGPADVCDPDLAPSSESLGTWPTCGGKTALLTDPWVMSGRGGRVGGRRG